MSNGRTHRSYVSYIDKSRAYYEAHGYERAYQWAHYLEVPFCRLKQSLSESRLGIVTTADKGKRDAPRNEKLFVESNAHAGSLLTEKSWDREATHTDDPETYLPVKRLEELTQAGRFASLSPRFYGVPTDYSQRLTRERDAPQIERWLREDAVDTALLVAI